MYTLSVFDTSRIQAYIFASNRLREQVGASYLVSQATEDWIYAILRGEGDPSTAFSPTNLAPEGLERDRDWHLEDQPEPLPERAVELLYCGGGNAYLLFAHRAAALAFSMALSRKLLTEAPGLRIHVAHISFDWHSEALGGPEGVFSQAQQKLDAAKQQYQDARLLGLGVSLVCRSSGLPATGLDFEEQTRPVSAEILAKVEPRLLDEADARLREQLRDPHKHDDELNRYAFSRDFDDLGRERGESSYIAVVHADGNAIGSRFHAIIKQNSAAGQNRQCISELQALSDAVKVVSNSALRTTLQEVLLPAFKSKHFEGFVHNLPHEKRTGKPILPFRPLVYGGDDTTFVCDGRLGLSLAASYLQAFEDAAKELPRGPTSACAGIAIVKTHYPFQRAYALSEQLCQSAKTLAKSLVKKDSAEMIPSSPPIPLIPSALDWQIAQSSISDDLAGIRARDYQVSFKEDNTPVTGHLNLRPLLIDSRRIDPTVALADQHWGFFQTVIENLIYHDEWRERRNKVVALREALRKGPQEVQRFLSLYGLRDLDFAALLNPDYPPALTKIAHPSIPINTGWLSREADNQAQWCAFFDAIEAIDLYLPWEEPSFGN
jgi:hypothetical protein